MSGGGGGGSNTNTVTTQPNIPGWVQAAGQQNLATAQGVAALPYTPYTGQTLAGFTPDQTAAFNAIQSMQGVAPGQINKAFGSLTNLPQTTQGLMASSYMPTVAGAATGGINQAATSALGDIRANAPNVNAFGGGEVAAQTAQLGAETTRNIGQATNMIASQGWNTAMNAAMSDASLLGNIAGAGQRSSLTDAMALASVGQQQQTQQQATYQNAMQQWQQAQNWPYQQLAIAQSALAGTPYGGTVQSSQPYSSNPLATALGMGAMGVGTLSAIPGAYSDLASWLTGYNPTTGLPTSSTLNALSAQAEGNVAGGAPGL